MAEQDIGMQKPGAGQGVLADTSAGQFELCSPTVGARESGDEFLYRRSLAVIFDIHVPQPRHRA